MKRAIFGLLLLTGCQKPEETHPHLSFGERLAESARDQLDWGTRYDPRYVRIGYPNGDVPRNMGVCTDVVIRAYRRQGIDLQKRIHEDIVRNTSTYGIRTPDMNIDHRRVPALTTFLRRKGKSLPRSQGWKAGDVVWWKLRNGRDHVGLISDRVGRSGHRLVIHNIGPAPSEDDVLSTPGWKIVGHYRYP